MTESEFKHYARGVNDTICNILASIIARGDDVDMDRKAIGLDVLQEILGDLMVKHNLELEAVEETEH